MKKLLLFILLLMVWATAQGQEYKNLEQYTVTAVYQKVSLPAGAMDPSGGSIDYVMVPADLEQGAYEVEISSTGSDLYQVDDSGFYVRFRDYYEHASYEMGILDVDSNGEGTFYKKPEGMT